MTTEIQELVEAAAAFVSKTWMVTCDWGPQETWDNARMRLESAIAAVERTTSPAVPSVPMDLSQVPREELEAFYARNRND